jgi:3-oxoacyl-[acyl-carrier protein] reductase
MALSNKTVLITGGSRGIGLCLVKNFAQKNAFVITTATTQDNCNQLQSVLNDLGLSAIVIPLNFLEEGSLEHFLKTLKQVQRPVDILINNAGITRDQLSLTMKPSFWDDVITTNLTGAFKITQALLRGMIKQGSGRVISISSVVAHLGNPGQINYCAAKAGLIGMSKALALEVASRKITVNLIAPGFIETDMTQELSEEKRQLILNQIPSKTLGLPEDVAHACLFLASDEAHYITGQTIHVNGGMYMP